MTVLTHCKFYSNTREVQKNAVNYFSRVTIGKKLGSTACKRIIGVKGRLISSTVNLVIPILIILTTELEAFWDQSLLTIYMNLTGGL